MTTSLRTKAFSQPLYIFDGLEMVRTEPKDGIFVGHIKISATDESTVTYDNDTLNETFRGGKEVSKAEYDRFVPPTSDKPS